MEGDWWTVYGQSCGQVDEHGDWGGAHDWVPCSHARFIQVEEELWYYAKSAIAALKSFNWGTGLLGSSNELKPYFSIALCQYFEPTTLNVIS